jgi:hypothetical protein
METYPHAKPSKGKHVNTVYPNHRLSSWYFSIPRSHFCFLTSIMVLMEGCGVGVKDQKADLNPLDSCLFFLRPEYSSLKQKMFTIYFS